MNGDGVPDLATADRADSVSVLANRGDGTFAAKLCYLAGFGPTSIAIGDLNGDGKPDPATADAFGNTVSVLTNGGVGSFEGFAYGTDEDPASVAIGDLNADGKPDLAIANDGGDNVSVLANATDLCAVPNVKGKTLSVASRLIARAGCRVGKIERAYSKSVRRGRVISQKPRFATVLPLGGKVDLGVSRGRKG